MLILLNDGPENIHAKKDQKLISDIEAQKTVLELGSVYWKAVNEFVVSKKIKITAKFIELE